MAKLLLFNVAVVAQATALIRTPPLGWNSWDCRGHPGSQAQLYTAAAEFKKLLTPVSYDMMVVDRYLEWSYEGGEGLAA